MRHILIACLGVALVAGNGRAENKGTVTEIDGLKSKVPDTWKQQEPNSNMRAFQFTIPKDKNDKYDAELVIFFFGKNGGGGVKANIDRWKGLIAPPEGKTIDDAAKVEEIKVGDVKVTLLDASGTYTVKTRPADPSDKGEKRDNYRLIGAVFESANGPYFIRLAGPAKTVEANKKGFDQWLKNFK